MNEILKYISSTYVFGIIPLDLLLHFIVGAIITIYCNYEKIPYRIIFLILFSLAGIKELNDYFFHFRVGWEEYFSDFLISFFYFFLSLTVREIRKKTDPNRSPPKKIKRG